METTFDKLYEAKAKKENKQKFRTEFFRFRFLNRLFGRLVLKNVKRVQIKNQISRMKNDLERVNKYYIHSLTEPTEDSVDLKMQMIRLDEKIKRTKEMYRTLFYGRFINFFLRLRK